MKHFESRGQSGVTRKEIVIFFAIIAVLTVFVIPLTRNTRGETLALARAKEVYLGLRFYADDHNGRFPHRRADGAPFANANEAYSQLLPTYMHSKLPFYIPGSAWSPQEPKEGDAAPPLAAGQNHWAYVPALTEKSERTFPILADGFAPGTPGTYPPGNGRQAVLIVRLDGSGTQMRLPKGEGRVIVEDKNGRQSDLFLPGPGWLKANQAPLNPAAGEGGAASSPVQR